MSEFLWWHVEDGVAIAYPDTREVRARVNTERDWYGTIEGCIIHGGVRATAFTRKVEKTYDAEAWLRYRTMVPAGEITTTKITAERAD